MNTYPILLKQPDNTFSTYTLFSKNSIKNNSVQKVLKDYHEKKRSIKCGCNKKEDLWLSVVKKDNFYYLRRYPNEHREHEMDCIFNNGADNLMKIDDNGNSTYSPKIFEDTENLPHKKEINELSKRKIEHGKRNTFYAYCSELVAESSIYAFNYVNYKNTINNFKNFTYKDFIARFRNVIERMKLFKYDNVNQYCDENKGNMLRFGIIEHDIALIANHPSYKDDDMVEIGLYGNFASLKVSIKRLKIAIKKVKLFDDYISPPYFFIAPTFYGKATRLYLQPIYFNGIDFCCVESGRERKYAKELFLNKVPFIKPLDNSELFKIKKDKIIPPGQKMFNLSHRPDFIEFRDGKIVIIEVSGNMDEDYKEQLQDKEKDYKKIVENNSYVEYYRC